MTGEGTVHLRHSLLFIFDAIRKKKIAAVNEAKSAKEWIDGIYGPNTVSETTCKTWFAKFRAGDRSLNDEPRSGRPQVVDDEELRRLVEEDDKLTTEEMAQVLGCGATTIRENLHRIGKRWKLGRWVPRELTEEKKRARVRITTELLKRFEGEQLSLDDIVTGDETWILYNNVVRHHRWVDKGSTPAPTPKPGLYPNKVQLCVWWSVRGVLHWELRPRGETVNSAVYCRQLEDVNQSLRHGPLKEKHCYKKVYLFLHDNATPHTAKVTTAKTKELNLIVLPHPADSPDLAPTDYHLNLSLKNFLRGKQFQSEDEIRKALEHFFSLKGPQFYREGIEGLPERWREVILSGGEYVREH